MYLNIINNINVENKRSNKNLYDKKEEELDNDIEENGSIQANSSSIKSYYSLFYGELTKTWINLKP